MAKVNVKKLLCEARFPLPEDKANCGLRVDKDTLEWFNSVRLSVLREALIIKDELSPTFKGECSANQLVRLMLADFCARYGIPIKSKLKEGED